MYAAFSVGLFGAASRGAGGGGGGGVLYAFIFILLIFILLIIIVVIGDLFFIVRRWRVFQFRRRVCRVHVRRVLGIAAGVVVRWFQCW